MRLPTVFPHLRALRITGVLASPDHITMTASTHHRSALCPLCQCQSRSVHSHYDRVLQDLPWGGIAVTIHLRVRRFRCRTVHCPRQVFVERVPDLAAVHSRRTQPLRSALLEIASVLGGLPGSRLAGALGMSVSNSTLLRLLRSSSDTAASQPRVLGIDDWAFARGQCYGTILVDLEQHRPVDLLHDRTAAVGAAWFREHDTIEIVSRDRSGAYAEAVTTALPHAIQVADRWHLLKNLGDALDTLLQRHHHLLRDNAPIPPRTDASPLPPLRHVPPPQPDAHAEREKAERRARRHARYEHVMTLHDQGVSLNEIARQVGLSSRTVRRYLQAAAFPEIRPHGPLPSILDPYEGYILNRWNDGCRNGAQLFREICAKGYPGGPSLVRRLTARLRQAQGLRSGQRRVSSILPEMRSGLDIRSPRQARWLFLRRPQQLTDEQRDAVARLRMNPELDVVYQLVQRFTTLVREHRSDEFSPWLEDIAGCGIREMVSVADGLRRDRRAVEAGIRLPWSQGQTEGHVNRLKLIKRQMYGRANLDLLRIRLLHHN